jgi:hypothetical protein
LQDERGADDAEIAEGGCSRDPLEVADDADSKPAARQLNSGAGQSTHCIRAGCYSIPRVNGSDETPNQLQRRAAAQLREGFRERLSETIDTTGKLIAALAGLGVLFFVTGYFVQWQRLKRGDLPPEEILPLIPREQIPAAGVRELVVSVVFVGALLIALGFVRARLVRPAKSGTRQGVLEKLSSWDAGVPALIVGFLTLFFAPRDLEGVVAAVALSALTYYWLRRIRAYLAATAGLREASADAADEIGDVTERPAFPLWRLVIAVAIVAVILSGVRQREFPDPRAKVTVVLTDRDPIKGVFLGVNSDRVLVRVQPKDQAPRLMVLPSSDIQSIRLRRGRNILFGGPPHSWFDDTIGHLFNVQLTCIPPECRAGGDTRLGPSSFF